MSKIKIGPDVFLGSHELNRFKKFLDDDGFRKLFLKDTIAFGIFNNTKDGNYDNFRVEQGTNAGTVKHAEGFAVDKNGNIITKSVTDNFSVPNDNLWYWMKIKYQVSSLEIGTVSVDINGNLTGTGTEFLTILRGSPNNPSRIKFSGSVTNTGEYSVTEVVNDSSAILAGDFVAESNLRLIVVGSFTPDVVISAGNKDIFQYDSCLMTLVQESVLNTPPALLSDEEFVIARIRRNGVTLNIEDKRYAIYKSKTDFILSRLSAATNPLIGVEAVKFNNIRDPRNKNVVYMAWGFRSTNWTIDPNTNRLTIIAGQGGKFKDTTYFTDGDFNGWRVYAKNSTAAGSWSSYAIIRASTKVGTQINLILDLLDATLFADSAQELVVVPDADSIEIIFNAHPADATELTSKVFEFKINEAFVRIPVSVYKTPSCTYNVQYRLNTFGDYRKPVAIPSDPVGFLNETSFNTDGVQTGTARTAYVSHATNGFVTLTEAPNAYATRLGSVETGDIFGVQYKELDNAAPIYDVEVGIAKQYQFMRTVALLDGGLGTPYSLTVDHYLNLKSTSSVGIKNGNSFYLRFAGDYTPGAFKIILTQDYVNPGNPGTLLYTFGASDFDESRGNSIIFRCIFDGANWVVRRVWVEDGSSAVINHSLDTVDKTGFFYAGPSATNKPGGAGDGHVLSQVNDANNMSQMYFNGPTDRVFYRRKSAGTWGSWIEFATTAGTVIPSRNLIAGAGMVGGGDLSADRTFDVNPDNVTVEISADAVRVKDLGISTAKLANLAVDATKLATDAVTNTKIQDNAVTTTKISDANVTAAKLAAGAAVSNIGFTPAAAARNLVAGSGLSGGGDLSADRTFDVNVDGVSVQISSDTVRLPNGYKAVQSPDGIQLYTKVIQIGDWNMASDVSIPVSHGLGADYKKVRHVSVMIRADDDVNYHNMTSSGNVDGVVNGGTSTITSTTITLIRRDTPGTFANTLYDSTGYNRGWITFFMEA